VWEKIVECAARIRYQATQGLSERQLATLKKLLAKVRQNLQSVESTAVDSCDAVSTVA
jgi:hypothetical protein